MRPLLELKDLHVHLGTLYIIQGVNFRVHEGENLAILGRNGAGKTTLLKSIMGILKPSKGSIKFRGRDITGARLHERARMGIGYVPDTRRIFGSLTVRENLLLGAAGIDKKIIPERLEFVLKIFPDLAKLMNHKARNLSGGQQQMLNIARIIVNPHRRLLLVDEPTEGLSPLYVKRISEAFEVLTREGVTIILVETKPLLVKRITKRYVILSHGKIVKEGDSGELFENPEIMRRYIGVEMRGG
ncbi:MAG: ABC transporter ATP-binding protein [Desulfurococcales archaeon]|nr:ABC transporter ATP-binding protein [Desulfurococcales archaeon]